MDQPTLKVLQNIENMKNDKQLLLNYIQENCYLKLYEKMVKENILQYRKEDEDFIKCKITKKIEEIGDNHDELSELYAYILDEENMTKHISKVKKIDGLFTAIRINFILNEKARLDELFNKLKSEESKFDWEYRNKYYLYYGFYMMIENSFMVASQFFLKSISSFNSPELISYSQACKYFLFTAFMSLDRNVLSRIVAINDIVENSNFFMYLYELALTTCNSEYSLIFKKMIPAIEEEIITDIFISNKSFYFIKSLKARVYLEIMQSYLNIKLEKIAELLNVDVHYAENDIIQIIRELDISYKIDGIDRVIIKI